MSLNNYVRLSGRCAEAPKKRLTKHQKPMVSLTVYTREYHRGEHINEAHRCLFFGSQVEALCDRAEKGQHIELEGMLRTQRQGEGKNARYYTSIVVSRFQLTGRERLGALRDCIREIVNENEITNPNELAIFKGYEK